MDGYLKIKIEMLEEEVSILKNKIEKYKELKTIKKYEKRLKELKSMYLVKISDDQYDIFLKSNKRFVKSINKKELDEMNKEKRQLIYTCNLYYKWRW